MIKYEIYKGTKIFMIYYRIIKTDPWFVVGSRVFTTIKEARNFINKRLEHKGKLYWSL